MNEYTIFVGNFDILINGGYIMFNETTLLRRLSRRIGRKLFECLDEEYFLDILNEETLVTFSTFYPKIVRGIRITASNAIPVYDPITGIQQYQKYWIPTLNPEDEYLDIEQYFFIGQGLEQSLIGANPPLLEGLFSKLTSLQPQAPVKWSVTFESPNFCEIHPFRRNHVDFVLNMQRKVRLNEIPSGLWEYFLKLFVLDVKWTIYNDYPNARDSGIINGIEIDTKIGEFSSAESDRESLLDTLNKDFALNPDRFDAAFCQSGAL